MNKITKQLKTAISPDWEKEVRTTMMHMFSTIEGDYEITIDMEKQIDYITNILKKVRHYIQEHRDRVERY